MFREHESSFPGTNFGGVSVLRKKLFLRLKKYVIELYVSSEIFFPGSSIPRTSGKVDLPCNILPENLN